MCQPHTPVTAVPTRACSVPLYPDDTELPCIWNCLSVYLSETVELNIVLYLKIGMTEP
jgi:hypothetical protein